MLYDDKVNFLICYGDTVGDAKTAICRASIDYSPEKVERLFFQKHGLALGIYSPDQIISCTQTGMDNEIIYEL